MLSLTMEHGIGPDRLVGSEIHGFHTMEDLDVGTILEEARTRWLRPNEIHAILCNPRFFTINVKPVTLPKSGTIVLFDRKMFRNFRKDGYNWRKKKDGKTIKEAHEHLKVGNEERIHVYYAHGEDNPSFVRRCYWLLEKSLDHIVLVHYRETQEPQSSPATSANSYSNSSVSPASWLVSEAPDSAEVQGYGGAIMPALEHDDLMIMENHEQRLHEINTLEWDELLGPEIPQRLSLPQEGTSAGSELQNLYRMTYPNPDSFGRWMSSHTAESLQSVADQALKSSTHEYSSHSNVQNHDASTLGQVFRIRDVSPHSALSNEVTKILIVGIFEGYRHFPGLELYLVCGNCVSPVEVIQTGVYSCLLFPQPPGSKNLYLSVDGIKPISQVLTFEFKAPVISDAPTSMEKADWAEFLIQMRLARLLFSSSSTTRALNTAKFSKTALMEAKAFSRKTSHISESWLYLSKMTEDARIFYPQVKNRLLELILQNKLREWLLDKVISGYKVSESDEMGLGVIHLCAILGYIWAVCPFSWSGLSLDYRDKFGWTALHWAAYYGKKQMVATLLSAGAKPNLVTDPTSESPGGCTAADLASKNGYDGLAAYLSEKALVSQFNDMALAGNMAGSLQTAANDMIINVENFTEEELNMKETLAAYRTAADAASRIQAAFREHSLKIRARADDPEIEIRDIIAAIKIQHAFRNYAARKEMAATRIQYRFRTWKKRKEFLHMRRQAIRIQAHFRGYQVRKQYRRLLWSVGVLEKVVLRWHMKRKGFRGLKVLHPDETVKEDSNQTSDVEEDFFRAGRRQAEDRVERSVTRVQAMIHSKQAQQEYRRMKAEHTKAKMELQHPEVDLG